MEHVNSFSCDSSIDREYKQALGSESYKEICDRVRDRLERVTTPPRNTSSYLHLSQNLLSPTKDTLTELMKTLNLHPLIVQYFEAGLEACRVCELVIISVRQTQANNQMIEWVIEQSKRKDDKTSNDSDQCLVIYKELEEFFRLVNPFSMVSKHRFHDIREKFVLFQKLKMNKKISKRANLPLIVTNSLAGIAAAPGKLMACLLGSQPKMAKPIPGNPKMIRGKKLTVQLDHAAKGLFALINYMDTMNIYAGVLYDKVEHMKESADSCMRSRKSVVLEHVLKEFDVNNTRFLKQLEELENLACLCLRDINKSRRSIVQEIMMPQHGG